MTDPRTLRRPMAGWMALALLNCAVIIPWLSSLWPMPRDFVAFYMAAQVYRHNPGYLLYNLPLQMRAEKQLCGFDDEMISKRFLPFNHLPYELALWLPLSALPLQRAFWIWRVECLGLLAGAASLFAKTLPANRDASAIFIMSLAFLPVPFSLMMGQDTCVTLALFAVALWLWQKNEKFLTGVALGLCLFKFQLVLPIIGIFVLCRSWRIIAGFASSGALAVGISTLMVGQEGMTGLLHMWLTVERAAVVCSPLMMPNVRGVLTVLTRLTPHLVIASTLVLSSLLLLLAAHQATTIARPSRIVALSMCFVVLCSFHTNLYDLSFLILPILVLIGNKVGSQRLHWTTMSLVFLFFCSPIYLIALASFKVGLLAILVAWLWYELSNYADEKVIFITASSKPCGAALAGVYGDPA